MAFGARELEPAFPPSPLKAGYAAPNTWDDANRSSTRITCRFTPCRSLPLPDLSRKGRAAPHGHGSPRQQGQRLHALVDRPTALTPSSNPRRGVDGHHQGLHRCALDGFLGPSSKAHSPTRILHHLSLNATLIIPHFVEPGTGPSGEQRPQCFLSYTNSTSSVRNGLCRQRDGSRRRPFPPVLWPFDARPRAHRGRDRSVSPCARRRRPSCPAVFRRLLRRACRRRSEKRRPTLRHKRVIRRSSTFARPPGSRPHAGARKSAPVLWAWMYSSVSLDAPRAAASLSASSLGFDVDDLAADDPARCRRPRPARPMTPKQPPARRRPTAAGQAPQRPGSKGRRPRSTAIPSPNTLWLVGPPGAGRRRPCTARSSCTNE